MRATPFILPLGGAALARLASVPNTARVWTRNAALLFATIGCSKPLDAPPVDASAPMPSRAVVASASGAAVQALPALEGDGPIIQIALEKMGPVTIAVPLGATELRPIVVAVHGHSVRPEHACKMWHRASHGYPFVVCPFGLPADAKPEQAVTVGSEAYTREEIAAGVKALRGRFGGHVSSAPPIYAGYSLGAKRGAGIVTSEAMYQRAAFGEGAYDELQRPKLRDMKRSGVERVLLVCSSRACEATFGRVAKDCAAVDLACRVVPSGENPHLFAGAVVEATREAWPWLVEGAQGYSSFDGR